MIPNGTYTRTNAFDKDEDRILPRFFINSVPDPLASEREGRPIFRDREEVELMIPGNPYSMPCHVVTDEHRQRWSKQYEAFKAGQEMSINGTPLEQWPILRRAQVMELKALNITTVEQLCDMSDHVCQRIGMGGTRLRLLAKSYLDEAEAGAALAKATADSEHKDARIAELERKVDEQNILLSRIHSEMQTIKNAPSAIATYVPGLNDPIEQAKHNPEPSAGSSLDALPELRRRPGRPPLPRDAQGNTIRE